MSASRPELPAPASARTLCSKAIRSCRWYSSSSADGSAEAAGAGEAGESLTFTNADAPLDDAPLDDAPCTRLCSNILSCLSLSASPHELSNGTSLASDTLARSARSISSSKRWLMVVSAILACMAFSKSSSLLETADRCFFLRRARVSAASSSCSACVPSASSGNWSAIFDAELGWFGDDVERRALAWTRRQSCGAALV